MECSSAKRLKQYSKTKREYLVVKSSRNRFLTSGRRVKLIIVLAIERNLKLLLFNVYMIENLPRERIPDGVVYIGHAQEAVTNKNVSE